MLIYTYSSDNCEKIYDLSNNILGTAVNDIFMGFNILVNYLKIYIQHLNNRIVIIINYITILYLI